MINKFWVICSIIFCFDNDNIFKNLIWYISIYDREDKKQWWIKSDKLPDKWRTFCPLVPCGDGRIDVTGGEIKNWKSVEYKGFPRVRVVLAIALILGFLAFMRTVGTGLQRKWRIVELTGWILGMLWRQDY